MLFGGGLAYFKLIADEGKRLDEDLLKTWQEKKQEKGQSAKILLNTGDLKSWDETDYVLGNIQWPPDYRTSLVFEWWKLVH